MYAFTKLGRGRMSTLQSWDLNFAVELGCEHRPGVRVCVYPGTYITWTEGLTNYVSQADVGEETANS
jgi:hypothetical protein